MSTEVLAITGVLGIVAVYVISVAAVWRNTEAYEIVQLAGATCWRKEEMNDGDIDLPLWNKAETDVLPQFQLSYGHAIVGTGDAVPVERCLRKVLRLRKPLRAGASDSMPFPRQSEQNVAVLATDSEWHFLLVPKTEHTLVFGPHRLFFSSEPWNRLAAKLRCVVCMVTRMVETEFFHHVFRGAKWAYNAYTDLDGVHLIEENEIAITINRKLAFHSPMRQPSATDAEIRMMRADRYLDSDQGGNVMIRSIFTADQDCADIGHLNVHRIVYEAGQFLR